MLNKQGKKKAGQSTIEYIVLVTGVIALLIVFLKPETGFFSQAYNRVLHTGTNGMEDMANRLANSRYDQPAAVSADGGQDGDPSTPR